MRVIDRAGRMAFDMLGTPDIPVYTTNTVHPSALMVDIKSDTLPYCHISQGWSQRPGYGKALGTNFVRRYEAEITRWFNKARRTNGKNESEENG